MLPARKRSGIGRQLMRHAFTWAATHHPGKAVYLEVLRDNAPAVAFVDRGGRRPPPAHPGLQTRARDGQVGYAGTTWKKWVGRWTATPS